MALENIEYVREGQLGFITINRPDVRNALNKQTLDEIEEALDRASADREVGVVIFTGKGDKSFAAGADINQLTEKTAVDALQGNGMQDIYNKIESFEKPTIAMINGYALGGGCELAMSCDIRVASTNAKLGLPELNLSIIPGAGGTQRLARLVGKGKALEMILTGKIIDAEEALQYGLITEVASPENLLDKVREVSEKILSKGPLAVQLAKLSVHMGTETDLKTGLMLEKLSQAVLFNSKDKNEGTKAFLEKRTPVFKGE
ncbi:enoyl-CoA hydratase-related protein [Halobacillus litoralis]|uniref:enoyl-CoA hydratase/isomerase family protein n=1 Tax=Halobacillus litoralis TaxID=45668 RepID=UPI001CFEA726|nr:enoyl-CoA hydratase-related protein [Halobacillus litoralis]WLR49185.1 enoyl-CoA hydratase-related protein [Halobacillus litoralis]